MTLHYLSEQFAGVQSHDPSGISPFPSPGTPRKWRAVIHPCSYGFFVGVRSEEHKIALERAARSLNVVVMNWC